MEYSDKGSLSKTEPACLLANIYDARGKKPSDRKPVFRYSVRNMPQG